MKTLCVFIGASTGNNSNFLEATKILGKELARRNITLIYGGGRLGLMGILADTVLENGGKVVGIITKSLHEIEAHFNLTEMHIVESMQERKKLMIERSDGFMVFPGGLGTLEELFEIWNAAKLKLHNKPLGLLNIENYFSKLMKFIEHSICEGFLKQESQELMKMCDNLIELLDLLFESYVEQELDASLRWHDKLMP